MGENSLNGAGNGNHDFLPDPDCHLITTLTEQNGAFCVLLLLPPKPGRNNPSLTF
jgi:hypothetical protein